MSPPLRVITILWIVCFLFGSVGNVRSAESDPAFNTAKQTFLRQMKKKQIEARIEAVETFARSPSPQVLEVLLKRGLIETEPAVRLAVRRALRTMGDNISTNRTLEAEFVRYSKKSDHDELLSGLLGGMVATQDANRISEVVKVLDDYLDSPKGRLIVPFSLIDDLGLEGGSEAVRTISILARAKLFESQFAYRRCVVQAMCQIREPAAIGFLVEMLPSSAGLVQAEIIQHLTRATKQKFKDNDRLWTEWWAENKGSFQFPAALADDEIDPVQTTYYGIPICAKRVVFVLDTSVSMRGYPMEAAKVSLLKTIESLPESVNFDMVLFDKTADVWQPRLLLATLPVKQMAAQTVITRGLGIGTCSHAALNAAFNLNPEVIYFLSDGEPTDGQVAQIVESMSERNRTRRISIYTIGVVTRRGGGAGLTFFMKPLAEHNFGSFRLVDQ